MFGKKDMAKAPAKPAAPVAPEVDPKLQTLVSLLLETLPYLQYSGHISAHDLKDRINAFIANA